MIVIESFACKETKNIWQGKRSSNVPRKYSEQSIEKVTSVGCSLNLEDLRNPPGNRLEALKGNRSKQYSIRIQSPWRICFTWNKDNAIDVEIVDYH